MGQLKSSILLSALTSLTPLYGQWITDIIVQPPQPEVDDEIITIVRGNFPDNTFDWFDQSFQRDGHTLIIILRAASRGGIGIPRLIPWEVQHNWGRLEEGEWTVWARYYLRYANQQQFELRGEERFQFTIMSREQRHSIPLRQGWSLISSNIIPTNPDVRALFQSLVDRGTLIIVKDPQGRFYAPAWRFNNIPAWDFRSSYAVKVSRADTLVITGDVAEEETAIPLEAGWNGVSYLIAVSVPAPVALSSIRDVLLLAKDGEGHFYDPSRNFNNIPPLTLGRGYLVKVSQRANLIWQRGN